MKTNRYYTAFTKWEFLIVVSIIAFLAFIGKPNITKPTSRAKVARAKADLRIISNALDTYKADNGFLPSEIHSLVEPETNNPISKIDPFAKERNDLPEFHYHYFVYEEGQNYILISRGPDGNFEHDYSAEIIPELELEGLTYDPLNGTVSGGDIFRVGP